VPRRKGRLKDVTLIQNDLNGAIQEEGKERENHVTIGFEKELILCLSARCRRGVKRKKGWRRVGSPLTLYEIRHRGGKKKKKKKGGKERDMDPNWVKMDFI